MKRILLNVFTLFALFSIAVSMNAQSALNTSYISEIEALYEEDQKYALNNSEKGGKYGSNTREVLSQMRQIKAAQANNLQKAKALIGEFGFPDISKVGKEACHQFNLVVLGFDEDVTFQMDVLRLMEQSVEKNDAIEEDFAYLSDRVRINMGMSQWYGTQMKKNKEGVYIPYEIENPKYVNQRRAEVGLPDLLLPEIGSNEKISEAPKPNLGKVRY